MGLHQKVAECQEACLGAMVALTTESTQARRMIASEGGIRAVIQSVETFRLDLGVQEMGIKAINNLCQGIPANVREAILGGAASALIGAMEMLLEDAVSQKWACSGICALTHEYSEGRAAIGSSGGVARVLEAFSAQSLFGVAPSCEVCNSI